MCHSGNGGKKKDADINLRERIGWRIGGLLLGAIGI